MIHETDKWLAFLLELNGLSREEIPSKKPGIESIVAELKLVPLLPRLSLVDGLGEILC